MWLLPCIRMTSTWRREDRNKRGVGTKCWKNVWVMEKPKIWEIVKKREIKVINALDFSRMGQCLLRTARKDGCLLYCQNKLLRSSLRYSIYCKHLQTVIHWPWNCVIRSSSKRKTQVHQVYVGLCTERTKIFQLKQSNYSPVMDSLCQISSVYIRQYYKAIQRNQDL